MHAELAAEDQSGCAPVTISLKVIKV